MSQPERLEGSRHSRSIEFFGVALMTETDSLWRTTIHVILPTHTGARLLLLPDALGWVVTGSPFA